jgi:translation initiation factor IF-2
VAHEVEKRMANDVRQRRVVEIPPTIVVRDLADRLEISPVSLLKALIANGIMAKITEPIDFETAAIVAEDLGFTLQLEGTGPPPAEAVAPGMAEEAAEPVAGPPGVPWYLANEPEERLVTRAPIVTVMGHVDHGKTSLLDAIRHAHVAAGESGGITQHIGAYTVRHDGHGITFIDTPGHEAFTAMRSRGAQATDIAVIVVAADDGVMPQTREAIDHARAAGVPMIVAVNKIDLAAAKPDRVLEQLAGLGLVPDSWGGDTFFVPVSALTRQGLDELLDAILLVAEEHPPRANPSRPALGTVLEGRIDQQRGVVADLLVQSGVLHRGDTVVIDTTFGRIRAMFDEAGQRINEAGPAVPVEIMGLGSVPEAGSRFEVVESDKVAKALVALRLQAAQRPAGPAVERPMTLEELFARASAGEARGLNLVVKTDAQGTLEPVVDELNRLSGEIQVHILHSGTGDISENDVNLAAASDAVVIGFRVGVDGPARRAAAAKRVEVRTYDVIYTLVEDVRDALTGLLEPLFEEQSIGAAEVRAVFSIPRQGNVAGCYVTRGVVRRNALVNVVRDGDVLTQTGVASLKRFTEDVREVREGFECGIGLAGFQDFGVGDVLDFVVRERVR